MDINKLPSQQGRIIVVTGANSGLGFETTIALASKGAKVIMACRNLAKAATAKKSIEMQVPEADLDVMQIDLSSLESVRKFTKEFQAKYDRLDVLINNAGVMMPPYSKTEEGFELQFVSNYLGHFLLTGLLLPTIIKTPQSRIVSLSSISHRNGIINFDDLQSEESYSAKEAYGQSKLACLLFAFELQRRLENSGNTDTISVAAHPGIANTDLFQDFPKLIYYSLRYTIGLFVTQSPAAGAKPIIMAAIGDVDGGNYIGPTGFKEFKGKPGKATPTDLAKDESIAKRLWKESEKLVGFEYL